VNSERILQFRIGMFVIFGLLVMTMLIVWFGETPTLFRDQRYLVVRYDQAPGVSEGIPVRKNGIRIGEVVSIQFDERPNKPDGVLITLAIEDRFKLRSGSVPRLTRGLIGDVWIDMLPATGREPLMTSKTPEAALKYIVEGSVTPDPANALAAATDAFQNVKGTLAAIEEAARGLAAFTKKSEKLEAFLDSFSSMGTKVGGLADDLRGVVGANAGEIGPTLANFRQAAESFNRTFDADTQAQLKAALGQLAASVQRLDRILADVAPLATDLGAGPGAKPTTALGQTLGRASRMVYSLQLLTEALNDNGKLNTNGTLQRLLLSGDLYNNLSQLAGSANTALQLAERVLGNMNRFAERIANDPSVLGARVLSR
jgi:phospholipid/cholesterol/gamma-HCH transport system substrate-binding protein